MSDKLREAILQLKEIGVKIAELSEQSKTLRSEVAQEIATCGLGTVSEEQPIEFMLNGLSLIVSATKAKGAKDYNITFRELKVV